MANEFIIKNGFTSKGDGQIENNLNVTGRIDATSGVVLTLKTDDFNSAGIDKKTGISNVASNQSTVITNVSILRVSGSGGTDTPTIPDGVSGQRLTLYCVSFSGGSITYNALSMAGWTSFEMGAAGDCIDLLYDSTTGWVVLGSFGGTLTI
jgi:hypothetical protein